MLAAAFSLFVIPQASSQTKTNMEQTKTIRLVYPQWQGGKIEQWITEISDPKEAAQGYALGAELMNWLAPENPEQKTLTVPVSMAYDRKVIDGVWNRDIIAEQTRAAMAMVEVENPDRIITIGGECSVSVVPFSFLADKYGEDVATIWIDAHPDITLPSDGTYPGYHAMAVSALTGNGDAKILQPLKGKIEPKNILYAGLRDWERPAMEVRAREMGMTVLSPAEVRQNSDKVVEWLRSTGANHLLIHFDLDVLDPADIITAVGTTPDGMKISEVVRIITDAARQSHLVGLTIAENMPRTAIRLRQMLRELPLFK